MLRILLTNDDGYNAPGIQILYQKLQKFGEVFLVAPHDHMSGASVSRVFWYESKVYQHSANVWSVVGTPADAVHFGIFGLNLNPDIVISGANDGLNIGIDTIYSGTVGAAMEALKAKIKAIAFSCDFGYFEPAEQHFDEVMQYLLDHDLPTNKYLLNVNFYTKKHTAPKGILITDLAFRPMHHYYLATEPDKFKNRRNFLPYDFVENTDLWAAEYGYISITPLKLGNRTQSGLDELRRKASKVEE